MTHIGISCEFLGAKRNGTATYSRNLLLGLAELSGEQRYTAYLTTPEARALVPEADTIEPRVVGPYNAYARLMLTMPIDLVRRPVDLLHAQGWGPSWSPCPMVLTVHDIGWERFPRIYPRALALRLSVQVRSSVRRAVRVVASSHYTASDLRALYGVPAEKISVVYPPLSPEFTPVLDQAVMKKTLARYGVHGPYILYVGSIEPKKNVHRLIEAFAALRREDGIPHTLLIAGRPLWLAEETLRRPAELGVEPWVRFTGPARQEDLAALYSGADAFAFLGMYEGFGYPPLEALACGAPVLAANRTSLPEVLGDAALLADPDDLGTVVTGLRRLLGDSGLRSTLRERGLARVAQFQIGTHARQLADIFAACTKRLPHPPAPSPVRGRGVAQDSISQLDQGMTTGSVVESPLSQAWERGTGGEGKSISHENESRVRQRGFL